jgi:hypothetical protein
MAYSRDSKSAKVRTQLTHPVIDGDGHWLEPIPIFLDYLRQVAGPKMTGAVEKFMKKASDTTWYDISPADRLDRRLMRPTWWGEPARTLDRATAMIPRLFYERLDDFGIDFALVYTSLGLFYVSNPDEELRRAVARAVNRMNAEMFAPFKDRMTPAAVVPMHTPEEAIEEATYAVRELGLKVVMIANHVRRPVPAAAALVADPLDPRAHVHRLARLRERLRLRSVLAHVSRSEGGGHRALRQHGLARPRVGRQLHVQPHRSLRQCQPRLRARPHSRRRDPPLPRSALRLPRGRRGLGVQPRQRPRRALGAAAPRGDGGADAPHQCRSPGAGPALRQFGGRVYEEKTEEIFRCIALPEPFKTAEELTDRAYRQPAFDDFGRVPVKSADELRQHFAERFYFGCEADDPMTAWAFDPHGNHRLRPIFSSDVGHFDVVDMTEVLEEAYELVEHGMITEDDLREFLFTNPARLHTAANPDFYKGTVVEDAVAKELARC